MNDLPKLNGEWREKVSSLYGLLPTWLVGFATLACLALVLQDDGQPTLRLALVLLLGIGAVVFFLLPPMGGRDDRPADLAAKRSLLLAAALWIAALPLVFWLFHTSATAPPPEGWVRQAYVDKRWLIGLYWTTVLAVLWLPLALYGSWRQWLAPQAPENGDHEVVAEGPVRFRARHARSLVLALVISTLSFGPPWNVEWTYLPINPHETVHWGGLLAIHHGEIPYIGPASVNYGPGAQLAMYGYSEAAGQLTVSTTRKTFSMALWIAVFLFSAIALLALPTWQAFLAIGVMVIASPVAGWGWNRGGVLLGFYGWANLLRNIASLVLSFGIFAMIRMGTQRMPNRPVALALGVIWGGFAYYAQENLFGGLLALCFLVGLAVAGRLLSLRGAWITAGYVVSGFLGVWLPIALIYGKLGYLGDFLHNYFLVPGRFMKGYANTPYLGTLAEDPLALPFYVTPFLALLLGASALFKRRPLRPAFPLSPDRFLVVSMVFAFLAAYPSGLLRSDSHHFQSTTFAVPILIVIGIFGLRHRPIRKNARPSTPIVTMALAALMALLTYWPAWKEAPARLMDQARGRWQSFQLAQKPLPTQTNPTITEYRLGPLLAGNKKNLRDIELLNQVKAIVGEDPVLVLVQAPFAELPSPQYIFEGFVYFLGDFRAGPIAMERSDMVGNQADLDRFLEHLRRRVDDFTWVVSLTAKSPEIDIFKAANPGVAYQTVEVESAVFHIYGPAQ